MMMVMMMMMKLLLLVCAENYEARLIYRTKNSVDADSDYEYLGHGL